MRYTETGTCAICGKEYQHWGNNPQPVFREFEKRVCDDCNLKEVIPARIKLIDRYEAEKN